MPGAIRHLGASTQQHLEVTDTDQEPATADERPGKTMAPVLWLSVAVMVFSPLAYHTTLGRGSTTLLVGGTAVIALRRSGARPVLLHSGELTVLVLTAVSLLSRELGPSENTLTTIGTALLCLLLLITPGVVVVRLSQRPKVTLDTVAGALAAYIQIGMFFASLYALLALIGPTEFFTSVSHATLMDYQFFSFITLTTVGYGNLIPATDAGRSFAMLEAVLGQVFLVTVVALAVGHVGTKVPRRQR